MVSRFLAAGRLRMLPDLMAATVVMAVTLVVWGFSLVIETNAHQHVDLVVLSVAVSISLARSHLERSGRPGWLPVVVLPLATAGASYVGTWMARDQRKGDVIFVVVVAACIWIRRFGPTTTRVGVLVTIPMIAGLVTPYVPQPGPARAGWSALLGAVAAVVCVALSAGLRRQGGCFGTVAVTVPRRTEPGTQQRFAPSTRMAVQMGVAVALGFVIGRHVHAAHWQWPVLTAYIVGSGNQGRGDVAYKGLLRGVGACVGSMAAGLLPGRYAMGDQRAVILIFLILWFALFVRRAGYAYWAGCVTAALALVYGYFGDAGTALLELRLEGIGLGAVAAVLTAWFILPVRTGDVIRRRLGVLLEALGVLVQGSGERPAELGARDVRPVVVAVVALGRAMQPLQARARMFRLIGLRDPQAPMLPAAQASAEQARTLVRLGRGAAGAMQDPDVVAARSAYLEHLAAVRASLRSRQPADFVPIAAPDERPGEDPEGPIADGQGEIVALFGDLDEALVRLGPAVARL